jgi:transposase
VFDPSTGWEMTSWTSGLQEASPTPCQVKMGGTLRQLDYRYDHFGNLGQQTKQVYPRLPGTSMNMAGWNGQCTQSVTETYQYDEMQRLLSETRGGAAEKYAYDVTGNIVSKSDFGDTYSYGDVSRANGNAGPHAVTKVSKGGILVASYAYDLNGNMITVRVRRPPSLRHLIAGYSHCMKRGTRKEWEQRVARWRRSGQTASDFAAAEDLHPRTLTWWSSALKRASRRTAAPRFVEVVAPRAAPATSPASIEVLIRDQIRLRVCGDFEPALLRRVVAALEGR